MKKFIVFMLLIFVYFYQAAAIWIYYLEEEKESSDDDEYESDILWYIYKIKIDGTGKERLAKDNIGRINVVGEWIYFISFSDEAHLYKMQTNGTDKTNLLCKYGRLF